MTPPDKPHRLGPIAQSVAQFVAEHRTSFGGAVRDPHALLATALLQATELQAWLGAQISGQRMPGDFRTRAVAVCFGVAQEHQRGIVDLLRGEPPNHSSALALMRPQFDAFVRGMWLALCADDAQLERYGAGGSPPNMPAMIDAIEKVPDGAPWPAVRKIYDEWWAEMSGLTHTGVQHLARWSGGEVLEPVADPLELVGVVDFVSRIALLGTAGIARMATDEKDIIALLTEGRKRLPPRRPSSQAAGGQTGGLAARGPIP